MKLTADGNVKVLDFGLAKALEGPAPAAGNPSISPTLTVQGTQAGVIMGTAAYMAPEQARGVVVDKRADIWAYGVVLYEMLTGQQPFAGATVSDTLAAVLKTEPDLTQVPAQTQRLLRRCLDKDPKRRLRDIGDAKILLEESPPDTAPAPKSSYWWKVAAGALAVIAVIVLALLWRATRPVSQPITRLSVELPEFAVPPFDTAHGASVPFHRTGGASFIPVAPRTVRFACTRARLTRSRLHPCQGLKAPSVRSSHRMGRLSAFSRAAS